MLLLLVTLTVSALVTSVCLNGNCRTNVGYRNFFGMAAQQALEGDKASIVLLIVLIMLLVLMVSVVVLSVFVYLKKEHMRHSVI